MQKNNLHCELCNNVKILPTRFRHLEYASSKTKKGHILELGVQEGKTLRTLLSSFRGREIYGFDSFEGIPEDWVCSSTDIRPKGKYKVNRIPSFPNNVKLVKGWFDDTIPKWLNEHEGHIALLHIDSDLYSSCKTILSLLNERIIKDTVIVFDELCDWYGNKGYENWREGEWKALNEWLEEYNREVIPLARTHCFRGSFIVKK